MDPISYGVAAKQKQRIEKIIAEPDSTSGVITVPQVIATGETITVPAGRTAILPNVRVDGELVVYGEVFIPSGGSYSEGIEVDVAVVKQNGNVVANDIDVVHKTGDETIAGVKTFSSSPIVPNATTATQPIAYGQAVKLTGDETISGTKTFSSSPVVPNATTVGQVVNKGQLDTKQDTLVSGTNIKTINSTSLLGSGDISVVSLTGNETISGTKTFSNTIIGNISGTATTATNLSGGSVSGTTGSFSGVLSINSTTPTLINAGSNSSYGSGIKFLNNSYAHHSIGVKGSSFVISNTSSGPTGWDSPLDRLTIDSSGNATFSGTVSGTSFNSITALSSTTPVMNGTAAIGTSTTVARADHVHGSDTTKASLSGAAFTGAVTGTSFNSITGLSSTTPVMNGTAAVGTGTTAARADHVHASDTSKASLSGATFTGAVSGTTFSATTFTGALSGNATTATTATNLNAGTTGQVILPSLSSGPASPVAGQVYYNTAKKNMYMHDGSQWNQMAIGNTGFKYRQIITTSYVLGGYKDSSPWKNVNRMVHATDVCTNLGDQLPYAASYKQGAPSKTTAWVFGAANAHSSASANVVGMDMATETGRAVNSGNFMWTARSDAGVAFKEHEYVYIMSGGNMDKFNFTTETSSNPGMAILADGTGSGVQGICDDTHALIYGDNTGQIISFYTDTLSRDYVLSGPAGGNNNQQKAINSKVGKGYAGNEGTYNGGYNFRVWDMTTNTMDRTVAKVEGNTGEENYDMGQDHQYMLGNYNGAQNNNGHKFMYASDSGFTLGSGSVRTGVPGGSSGITAWKG